MNWFRELLIVITRLFGTKSSAERRGAPQRGRPVSNVPLKTSQVPEKEPSKTIGDTTKAASAPATYTSKPEQTVPTDPVWAAKQRVMPTADISTIIQRVDLIPEPETIPAEQTEPAVLPLPVTVEPKADIASDTLVRTEAQAAKIQDSLPEALTVPVEDDVTVIQQENTMPELETISAEQAEPAVLPLPVTVEPEADITLDTLVETEALAVKVPENLPELQPSSQTRFSNEFKLCAPKHSNWEEDQKNEFTLWQFRQNSEDGESMPCQLARIRIVRQEPLNLPPTHDEAMWAQNAVQAADLILMPFRSRTGTIKAFVAEGIVTVIWEEKRKELKATGFAAVVLTRQIAYILTGQKENQFSAEQLSKCFVLQQKQGHTQNLDATKV